MSPEIYDMIWYDMIHLLTAIGLTPGGSSTVHIYTHKHYTNENQKFIIMSTRVHQLEQVQKRDFKFPPSYEWNVHCVVLLAALESS